MNRNGHCIRLSTLELTVLAWFACLSLFLFTAVPLLRFHSSDKTVVKSERCLLNSDTTLSTNTPITEDSNSWITAVMLKDDYLAIYPPKYVYYLITYKTAGLKSILASPIHLLVCGGWTNGRRFVSQTKISNGVCFVKAVLPPRGLELLVRFTSWEISSSQGKSNVLVRFI